jgi:Delta3,5-Delta2,4-dienoyl-CoA isomerase
VPQVAEGIAAKSPLAVWGTKRTLQRTRDGFGGGGGVPAGLEAVALHNAAFLLGEDIAEVLRSRGAKQAPRFAKL